MPWLGLAIGAISGAIAGAFSDIGIDDKFIKEVGTTIEPGHSALFLLVERMTEDRVLPELQKFHPTVLRTNLSTEDEEKLKAAFGAVGVSRDRQHGELHSPIHAGCCRAPVHYWVLPFMYVVAAILLGLLLPRIDRQFIPGNWETVSINSETAILSSIASGMMALTGIVFSMVLVSVQVAGSSYSPRLVQWLVHDPILRHALGVFTGTFIFALMALAAVDGGNSGRVPYLTTTDRPGVAAWEHFAAHCLDRACGPALHLKCALQGG